MIALENISVIYHVGAIRPHVLKEGSMPFSSSNITGDQIAAVLQELICPYFESGIESRCLASNMHVAVSSRYIVAYCCSDDHDRCPLFLAKALLALRS